MLLWVSDNDIQTKSFNLHCTHRKVIAKLYSFALRRKIPEK